MSQKQKSPERISSQTNQPIQNSAGGTRNWWKTSSYYKSAAFSVNNRTQKIVTTEDLLPPKLFAEAVLMYVSMASREI